MKRRRIANRILCAALILALLAGIVLIALGGAEREPESPLRETAEELLAEPQDGGSTSQHERQTEEPPEEPPEEEPEEEPEEPPEEEPEETPEEQPPEEPEHQENDPRETGSPAPTEETGDPTSSPTGEPEETPASPPKPQTEPPKEPDPEPSPGTEPSPSPQQPDPKPTDDPGEGGDKPGPGEGDDPGPDPVVSPSDEPRPGPTDPPAPVEQEVKIATDLPNGIVTQTELPDGRLRFYAYGVGADDLSVRVQVRRTGERKNATIYPIDDKNYTYTLELGESYQFTLYLYQPGHETKYVTRYVTYQADRADEEHPEVGEFPPFITTNIDHYADGAEIEGDNLALIVTVRSNPDYQVVTADSITVRLNGVSVEKHGGDSNPEYDLFFEPPNVGDYRDYKIEIVAWYGNNSRYWSKTLRYHSLAEGDEAGTVTIVLDATTVGLGILDEGEYDIVKGDTAADVLLRFMEDYGYDIRYDSVGANFYIRRISRSDMCYGAEVPPELWEAILRDGINLNEYQYDRDSLGEFDYTMGAGWMYAVDGAYPGRSMNRYEVKNGNTIYVRFSLAYGKDIGGFDASGGGQGALSGYCGLWINGWYQELSHDYQETERVEPTGAEPGYVEYTCSVCGAQYREELPAEAHEHVYEETDRVEPTETEDGYIEYTCSVCGETYRETLPAAGEHDHTYVETDRVDPTDTEDGYIEYTCSVCGDTFRETLPAAGGETPEDEPGEEEDAGGNEDG